MKFNNSFSFLKKHWWICAIFFASWLYITGIAIFSPKTLSIIQPYISLFMAIPAIFNLANILFLKHKNNKLPIYFCIGLLIIAFITSGYIDTISTNALYYSICYGIANVLMLLLFLTNNKDSWHSQTHSIFGTSASIL